MAKNEDPIVKCPYYNWDQGKQLCCEGVDTTAETCSVTVTFVDKQHRVEYQRKRCRRAWRECPLAQALEKKWEIST